MIGEEKTDGSTDNNASTQVPPNPEAGQNQTLVGFYANQKTHAKKLVRALNESSRRTFDPDDRRVALEMIAKCDPDFRRSLELAVQSLEAETRPVRDLILAWAGEILNREWRVRAPHVDLSVGAPAELFRMLVLSVAAPMANTPSSATPQTASRTSGTSDQPHEHTGARTDNVRRRRAHVNLVVLTFLWLSGTRNLSIIDIRAQLARAVQPSRYSAPRDLNEWASAYVASTRPDRLGALLAFAGLWEEAMQRARDDERAMRSAESRARYELDTVRSALADKQEGIDRMQREIANLKNEIAGLRSQMVAERQDGNASFRAQKARFLRLLEQHLSPYFEIAAEALESDPPAIDVALNNIARVRKGAREEIEWLRSSG